MLYTFKKGEENAVFIYADGTFILIAKIFEKGKKYSLEIVTWYMKNKKKSLSHVILCMIFESW